jgi:multidrug efflux pump subunit AcrB
MFNLASQARPYFWALVLTTALLSGAGVYSAWRMPSGVYPEVTFSRIAVVARVPGLSTANMEVQVTRPLEQAVSTVLGVAQVRSKTIRGGSELSIDFSPGTNMTEAKNNTWNRIGGVRSDLPPETELTVEQMTPSVWPLISLVLTGGDNASRLRDYAFYELAPKIKNIPDVLYANVAGGDLREIEVVARPDDLLAAGLSAADLADQIGKVHRLQPVGRIERPPFAFQVIVNTQGETARAIEELVIATKGQQTLRVRDVADVKVLHQDRMLSIGYEGQDAVVITVFRRLGGNAVNISRDLRALLAQQQPPPHIHVTLGYDQSTFVSTAVTNVRDAIVVGGFFSILILLLFLRSWRATLISAVAIPTTLAITFVFLHAIGETLNLMSLGGLAVAIGLIIDDTVVVIENIARHLAPGAAKKPLTPQPPLPQRGEGEPDNKTSTAPVLLPPLPSVGEGGRGGEGPAPDPVDAASGEITGAVVGSTLTTVLVFVPLAFIVGVYGQFFASLSWSLAIAVLVSMVISLTLIPVFAATFLRGKPMPAPGPIYRAVAYVYDLFLAAALRFPWVTLAVSVLALGAGVVLYSGIPNPYAVPEPGKPPPAPLVKGVETGLLPIMDEGAFTLDYWAPSGTTLQGTEELAKFCEHVLSENPDVQAYVRRTGAEMGLFATQTNRGDIQVVLRPAEDDPISLLAKPVRPKFADVEKELKEKGMEPDDKGKEYIRRKYRRRSANEVRKEVEEEIKERFSEHQLKIETMQIMEDELNDMSGQNKPIEIKLFGPNRKRLLDWAAKIGKALEEKADQHQGLSEVQDNVRAGNPDLMIEVDGVRAARLGMSAEQVERQLRAMFLGQVATQVRESAARITEVRVRYPDRLRFGHGRFDPELVLNQWLLLPEGTAPPAPSPPLAGPARAVPLAAVARIKRERSPDEQWRENQQPAHIVTAEVDQSEAGLGSVVGQVRQVMAEIELPPGCRWELGGHYLRQQEAFASLGMVLIAAVLMVYILLCFQFRSAALPLLIFLTQPLSLVSGLFALWLTGTPLNVSSYMGAILLIGLDMKNGIILVEYIQQLRGEGMKLRPALLLAGHTRFRPILMTSLAAILGLLPLALGIGPGAQMQQPLAVMVIGGLTANMLFTRLVIPAGYLVMERGSAA